MKKINWKDFKIKDEQPNLIDGGWGSFNPVGDGKNFLQSSPKFDDWLLIQGALASFEQNIYFDELDISYATRVTTKKGRGQGQISTKFAQGDYKISIFIKNLSEHSMFIRAGTPITYEFINPGEFVELKGFYQNADQIEFGGNYDLDFIAWNPMIYKDGSKPLTLLKEKVSSDLTRVITWGGSENGKLRFIANSEKVGEPLSFSMYIENNGSDISLNHDAPSTNNTIEKGYKGFFETQTEVSVGKYKYIGLGTEGNLDFIASDPQFVEGNKSNPVLLINELEYGREHVQVHGVKNDTKLISPKIEGLSGEPYQIKTNIENNGIEMSMSSTLGEEAIDISEGNNNINHTGELQGQHIIIELGAKDE